MTEIIIAGIDLAKNIMHFSLLNQEGKVFKKIKAKREEFLITVSGLPKNTLIAMEACGSSNFWAQEISQLGYKVKLIKTKDAKAYAKSKQKNDFNDALAVAKAARDPELKEVKAKTKDEQYINLIHKTRQNTIRDRIQKTNSLMSLLLEFGYATKLSKGRFCKQCDDEIEVAYHEKYISQESHDLLKVDCQEIAVLCKKEKDLDQLIVKSNKQNKAAIRLQKVIGIGPINASSLSNSSIESYPSPRDFAASLGLVPKQNTSGDKIVLGSITKQGDRYRRTMLIQAGRSVVMRAYKANCPDDRLINWAKRKIEEGKPFNVICVGVANKLARIAYVIVNQEQEYRAI